MNISDLQSQLLFFFSALGAFNGIIIGMFFLFIVRPKHLSHIFLGLLFLALSVRVGKSVFYYFSYDLANIYIQIGLFACWFIGPSYYFYVKSSLGLKKKWDKAISIHLTILIIASGLLFFIFPRSEFEELWVKFLVRLIYLQWTMYLLAGLYLAFKNREQINSFKKLPSFNLWFWSISVGNTLVCLAFNTANYSSYIVGALSFTFIFYLLLLLLLFSKKRAELLLLHPPKYGRNIIGKTMREDLKQQLIEVMEEKQTFLDPNIKLSQLSKILKTNNVILSQFFNEELKISFNDYLNQLRVGYAQKEMIKNPNLRIETIAYSSGFNSKSTFYKAFKKHIGTTPSNFLKSI